MPTIDEDELRQALPSHVTIVSRLGAGGQGDVFRGVCRGQPAAVKVFQPVTDDRRVDRECELLTRLTCPHVVRLIEHFPVSVGGTQYRVVAYELHDGGDLMQYVRPGSHAFSPRELVTIGHQVGIGIETLWLSRIVHRDIKPANIVRAVDGRHVLVDVGMARHVDRSDLTAAGWVLGTRGFRSPEQASGRRSLTIRSDVFSLGVTLYVLGTKSHPFRGNDILAPTPVDTAPLSSKGFPTPVVRLIREMLDFSAARRPTDLVARFSALGAT